MLARLADYPRRYLAWLFSSLMNGNLSAGSQRAVLVTGADSSHYLSLVQFLESAERVEASSTVVVWNLGLSQGEKSQLEARFPHAHFRDFPYHSLPSYFDIRVAAGEYAWKPVAIQMTAEEFCLGGNQRCLIWCDAGNVLFRKLRWVRRYTARHGVFSQYSGGTLGDWTHPDTLGHFSLEANALRRRNANAALVGLDPLSEAGATVLRLWAQLAEDKSVIAPEGSDRSNHRQDQAVLTCILISLGLLQDRAFRSKRTSEYRLHCDVETGQGLNQVWGLSGRRLPGV